MRFFKYFTNNTSSFPLIIVIILLGAFFALLIVILVTVFSIKKKNSLYDVSHTENNSEILPPSALSNNNNEENTNDKKPNNNSQNNTNQKNPILVFLLGERLAQFLINKGYIQVNNIIKSFFNANQYLKNTFGTKYKYALPWYAIVGTSSSGKSSLLQGFTRDDLDNKNNDALSWWFLKNGVVLDVSGNMFLESYHTKGLESSWNILLKVLYRYRQKKPINGIILTIPANELYGKNKLSIDNIKQRAQYIARKLYFTQLYLGIKLPIYIVITKTDIIPGFQSFCSEIPVRNRNNMLGWSFPFTLDTVYNPNILNLAFDSLENDLNEIRLEIFSENLMSSMKDGVFVFPSELLTIKESLSIYINTIFKDSSFLENGYFRGFYFTGDSKMIPLDKLPAGNNTNDANALAIMGTPDADINEVGNISASFKEEEYVPKKIFFFEDLLLRKVFMEDCVASPMRNKLNSAHKTIFASKVIIAILVFLGTYCLFGSTDKLNNNKNTLYPALYNLSSVIKDSNELDYKDLKYEDKNKLANCSNQLLSIIHKINKIDFKSLFIPASWFSNINYRIKDTLSEAYKKVIIRAIYINLLLKAKSLLDNQEPKNSSTLEESFHPFKSKEYIQLKEYLNDFLLLENNIKKFEHLKTLAYPRDLNDLIKYTFNSSLPSDIIKNYNDLKDILSNTTFPSLDIKSYKKVAYNNFIELLKNFVNSIFYTTSNTNVISQFSTFLNKLLKTNLKNLPNCKAVKDFSRALTIACNGFQEKDSDIYNVNIFEKDEDYKSLLKNIELLFGKEAVKQTNDIILNNVIYLKEQLSKLNDNLLKTKIINKDDDKKDSRNISNNKLKKEEVSNWVFELEKNLRELCSECFMEDSEDKELITEIPENKILYWDMELIDKAIAISLKYNDFCNSSLDKFPESIRDSLAIIARNNLYKIMKNTIAKAQIISDIPNDITNNISQEEVINRQVSELKEVSPKLTKLIEILKPDKYNKLFNNLNKLISKIGISLLENIDKFLKEQKPYMPANLTFDYWDGQKGGGLYLYSANDLEELELYLQSQREIVNKLAIEFAQPIVNFLNSIKYSNNNLLNKWNKIIEDYSSFSQKDLKSSVNLLETFIKNTLNECTIDNIKDLIQIKDIKNTTSDYFLNVMRDIKISILSRAEVLIRQRNIIRYEKLREYYKKYLEKYYPFRNPNNKEEIVRDADLELVKVLISLYNELGGSPEELLDTIYQLEEGKEAYKFIKKIHLFKELFGDLLGNNGEIIKLKLEADFSLNKGDESNVDYLVDRVFKPNHDANIEAINPDKSGIWYFGEPIEFNMRWAEDDKDAPSPLYNPKDNNLYIEKTTAKIKCDGAWSLLRFLQKYKSTLNYNKLHDPNQNILEFKIPLDDGKTARLFLGVTVFKPQSSDSVLSNSVTIPSIPGKMPPIPKGVLSYSNIPILINRIIGRIPSNELQKQINKIKQNNSQEEIEIDNDKLNIVQEQIKNGNEKRININDDQLNNNKETVKTSNREEDFMLEADKITLEQNNIQQNSKEKENNNANNKYNTELYKLPKNTKKNNTKVKTHNKLKQNNKKINNNRIQKSNNKTPIKTTKNKSNNEKQIIENNTQYVNDTTTTITNNTQNPNDKSQNITNNTTQINNNNKRLSNASKTEELKNIEEEVIQEDTNTKIEEILNDNNPPELHEDEALITISSHPIG